MRQQPDQSFNAPRPLVLSSAVKTALWFAFCFAIGVFGFGFYKGLSKSKANASINDTLKEGWVIGDNARIRALVKEFVPINFYRLSDYPYYTFDPQEKPNPKLLALNKIPSEVLALNGKKYALTGFMLPLDAQPDGTTEFILNGNQDMCYFGAPTQINEWVRVKYTGKAKLPFSHLPLTVFGTLEVGEERKDGRVQSLYRMTAPAISTVKGLLE